MLFKIKQWAAWAPGIETPEQWLSWANNSAEGSLLQGDASPKLLAVPAMQRRRMSRLSKMALEVAYACSGENTTLRTVFASRHGEIHRTTKILNELFSGEGVSPTAFSLSVHNAASGLYSIARNAPAPTTSVAAGQNTFMAGLFEALGFLKQAEQRVLLVFAEEPLPEAYHCFADESQNAYAFALWLEREDGEGVTHSITPISAQPKGPINNPDKDFTTLMPQGLMWLSHFLQKTPHFNLSGKREQWRCEC